MKKLIVLLWGMICVFHLSACVQGGSNIIAESDVTPTTHGAQELSQVSDQQITAYNILENVQVALSAEDADAIGNILYNVEWIDDITKCASDYEFVMKSGETYCYHSNCGTVNDFQEKRSFTLTDEQRDKINYLLAEATAD